MLLPSPLPSIRRPRKPLVPCRVHLVAVYAADRFVAYDLRRASPLLVHGRGVFA